jgi:hypothetical protein
MEALAYKEFEAYIVQTVPEIQPEYEQALAWSREARLKFTQDDWAELQ